MNNDTSVPGQILPSDEPVTINEGRETTSVIVVNTGDRPIQVGSHFHFFESNRALEFDRTAAFGKRLNILAGTAVRFEPGERTTVDLVEIGGKNRIQGMNNLVDGSAKSESNREAAIARARTAGFKFVNDDESGVADRTGDDTEDTK